MPGERRTLLRLLLAAAGATLVLAAPASGSPSVVYGVQDDAWLRYGPGTLAQRVDRLENLGVHLVRINVLWSEVEPRRGHFDWSGYDPVLAALHAAGIEPLLTLVSTPAWANGGRGTNWAPTSGATFAAFAAATARRYPYVRRFLIWNEPNQRRWLRPTSPAVYVTRLLNPAYAAIHRVRATALVGRDFGPSTRIWLTEYGYQTDPPDPYLGVSWAKQALYVSEAGLRAYLAPRVDLLVNFLVEDEPEISRWQSGFLTADGVEKPSYQAFQLPLAVEARHGDTITLWGQIRPGSGVQTYQLQERTGGRWLDVGGPARTGRRGFFTRVVAAGAGAAFRVVQLTRGLPSATVTG